MTSARLARCVRLLISAAGMLAVVTIAPILHAAQAWTVYLHHSGPLAIGMTVDDARKAIAAGTMDGSVAQFPSEMGRIAVENAVKLIHHEPVQAQTATKLEMITK